MFGVTDTSEHDNCISYLFLCLKFYIHRCKFQESDLSFVAFMNLIKAAEFLSALLLFVSTPPLIISGI